MAHVRIFAIYMENIQDASGQIPVRACKLANGVLRYFAHIINKPIFTTEVPHTDSVHM
jgi:hypothetical protein